jgi:perosamine synthetase
MATSSVGSGPALGRSGRSVRRRAFGRRLALLGGTTSFADCAVAIRHLLDSRSLTRGQAIADYEDAFARFVGTRYACSFAAGRVGLYGLLRILGIGTGDEVLLQVPTHIVVANAIRYTGAQPVYVDCELRTYNMDIEQAVPKITPRTKAIVLQHTFGIPADIDAAMTVAKEHGLSLIEDCVHSLGATYRNRQVGSLGRAAFFSTEETKTISTTMGGMVVTNDSELAAGMEAFQDKCLWPSASLTRRYMTKLAVYHVLTQPNVHRYSRAAYDRLGQRSPLPRPTSTEELFGRRPVDYEQRLSNAQAALGIRQLARLPSNLAHRAAVAEVYERRLAERGFRLPQPPSETAPAYVRYPVRVEDRASAIASVAPHAVLGTWFTSVLEEAAAPRYAGYEDGSCPNAEAAARHLVNLPTHPRVRPEDIDAIVAALSAGYAPSL